LAQAQLQGGIIHAGAVNDGVLRAAIADRVPTVIVVDAPAQLRVGAGGA